MDMGFSKDPSGGFLLDGKPCGTYNRRKRAVGCMQMGATVKKTLKIILRIVFSRTMITILLLLGQVYLIFASLLYFRDYTEYIYGSVIGLTGILVVYIVNKDENPGFKLAWILPVCLLPVAGAILFLFVEINPGNIGLKSAVRKSEKACKGLEKTKTRVRVALEKEDGRMRGLANYLENTTGLAAYGSTKVSYYSLGEYKFKALLEELEKAEKYIFMEYFIIERGVMWNSILEVLERKAKEGVEVRIMYDGMCSLLLLPYRYPKKLKAKGMKAKMFSPIKPMLSTHQNNRDHRKIAVIDGRVAFTGGVNLADEYINEKMLFGHWKDVAVKVEGEAAKGFLMLFLQMWNVGEPVKEDYGRYLGIAEEYIGKCPLTEQDKQECGYVFPYGDGPANHENIAENVYLDMLYSAKRYVHIMTPYFIVDHETLSAITFAAKRGVEVKLLLPHIPDKKIAFHIARTFYPVLLKEGVQIYEYTPGFVHGKCFVSDDEKAVVGTINLDYRSLYLHFECGVYLYKNKAIADIELDYRETIKRSQRITMDDFYKINIFSRLSGRIFRLFGPLM